MDVIIMCLNIDKLYPSKLVLVISNTREGAVTLGVLVLSLTDFRQSTTIDEQF